MVVKSYGLTHTWYYFHTIGGHCRQLGQSIPDQHMMARQAGRLPYKFPLQSNRIAVRRVAVKEEATRVLNQIAQKLA